MLAKVLKSAGEVHSGQIYMWYNPEIRLTNSLQTISLGGKPFAVYANALTPSTSTTEQIDRRSELILPYQEKEIIGHMYSRTGSSTSELRVEFYESSVKVSCTTIDTYQLLILYTIP